MGGLVVGLLALLAFGAPKGPGPLPADAKWRWYVACDRPATTRIHVTLAGKTLFDATVPVCRVAEADRSQKAERTTLKFTFRGDPTWFDGHVAAAPGTPVEGNIWQAGGETYGIIFGVSFASANRILLNTVHIAYDDRRSEGPIAKGLVVSTTPFRAKVGDVGEQAKP